MAKCKYCGAEVTIGERCGIRGVEDYKINSEEA